MAASPPGPSSYAVQEMKRSGLKSNKPLKRTGYLRRTGRLPAASKKARTFADELDAVTPALLERAGYRCEICRKATVEHRHHRLRRSQGGTNALDNLVACCHGCHEHIHRFPALAYEHGLLVRSAR